VREDLRDSTGDQGVPCVSWADGDGRTCLAEAVDVLLVVLGAENGEVEVEEKKAEQIGQE